MVRIFRHAPEAAPMQRTYFYLLFLVLASILLAEDGIQNGNFSEWENGFPAAWVDRSKQAYTPLDEDGGLRVEIVQSSGRSGEVLQKVALAAGKRYRISGEVYGSRAGVAYLQVKRYAGGKEVDRVSSSRNLDRQWTTLERTFSTESIDYIEVLLRWNQAEDFLGTVCQFRKLTVEEIPPLTYHGEEVLPRAVPTFHSVGLYWKPTGGSAQRTVHAEYRVKGAVDWREALPLWFDATEHSEEAAEHSAEYRGSIVHLEPGTPYEVRLQLEGGVERIVEFDTLSEDFKIARKVRLPRAVKDTFLISEGGSEAEGYVLYEAEPGTVWDADNQLKFQIKVEASWVIVRGLSLKGAINHGIVLDDVNHVVIEHCDISGWGETDKDGQAKNFNSAIFSGSSQLEHVIIQHCELHDPRSDSNSWKEKRPGTNSFHPAGPQGITFMKGKGLYIIRYNRIYSDIDHMFNDGMGEYRNFSFAGFPNRDSDIYGNYISHCWDDSLEIEGANMNVRVWNNYMDMTYGGIGGASTSLGPVYFFRNVYAVSRKHTGIDPNSFRGHYLLKLGNKRSSYTRGRVFVFHNTSLQPLSPSEEWPDPSAGAQSGMVFTSKENQQENMTSRNNIFQMRKASDWAIRDTQETLSNDFDYDLYNGRILARAQAEVNGIIGAPSYERAPDGRLWLAENSLGYDAGARIPNFNDDYAGKAPDVGAVERNSRRPKPRHWPDFPENFVP